MICPDCNTDMELIDTTTSYVNTDRAHEGQHTGDIFHCEICDTLWLENLLNNSKLEQWAY